MNDSALRAMKMKRVEQALQDASKVTRYTVIVSYVNKAPHMRFVKRKRVVAHYYATTGNLFIGHQPSRFNKAEDRFSSVLDVERYLNSRDV